LNECPECGGMSPCCTYEEISLDARLAKLEAKFNRLYGILKDSYTISGIHWKMEIDERNEKISE